MNHLISLSLLAAASLLSACGGKSVNRIDMPYCDGNLSSALELTAVERSESKTELTFLVMNTPGWLQFGMSKNVYITSGDDSLALVSSEGYTPGTEIKLRNGIPVQFKLTFPPLPADATQFDFIDPGKSRFRPCIWGIDLTGKRSANEFPTDVPAELLQHDFVNDTMPRIVTDSGTATINIHLAAFRPWISPNGRLIVNTMDDTQERIPFTTDKNGHATIRLPLKGTANVTVMYETNTYASTYVDPNENINIYVLPDNNSVSQRLRRPGGVTDGKYRNIKPMQQELLLFQLDADTTIYYATGPEDYIDRAINLHAATLDSIEARNFPPLLHQWARASADRKLMYQIIAPRLYTPGNYLEDITDVTDSVPVFTSEQLRRVARRIDFEAPALEIYSIGNPGWRTAWLRSRKALQESLR